MKLITLLFFLIFINAYSLYSIEYDKILEGDIIFQESISEQARAIKLATHSRYTHAGIIFKYDGKLAVLEAVQPVKISDLDSFIKRGINHHCVIKRLKNRGALLNETAIKKMKNIGGSFLGKKYDIYFEWNDSRIYCTELIWKIYKRALNIEIGKLERLQDFDLKHPYVKKIMRKRYGNRIPYNEMVISPESMYHSENLEKVFER